MNSDGVVPLSSQLHPTVQKQCSKQFGFNSSHTAILDNDELIAYILDQLKGVENIFPEEHLQYCFLGGYDVDLNNNYSPIVKFVIHNHGKYWMALSNGTLQPFYKEQEDFVKIVRGEVEVPAESDLVKGWLRFMREYPEFGL